MSHPDPSETVSNLTMGRNVRILRTARNMTGEELAARCGIGYQRHRRLEGGDIPFDIPLLVRIAEILDTTPGRLIDGPFTHRMIDLSGIPDEQATALEIMAEALRTDGRTPQGPEAPTPDMHADGSTT